MENMETITINANNTDNNSNKYDNNNNNNNIATKLSFIRTNKSQYFKKLYV